MGTLNNNTTVKRDGEILRMPGQKNMLNTEAREKKCSFSFQPQIRPPCNTSPEGNSESGKQIPFAG